MVFVFYYVLAAQPCSGMVIAVCRLIPRAMCDVSMNAFPLNPDGYVTMNLRIGPQVRCGAPAARRRPELAVQDPRARRRPRQEESAGRLEGHRLGAAAADGILRLVRRHAPAASRQLQGDHAVLPQTSRTILTSAACKLLVELTRASGVRGQHWSPETSCSLRCQCPLYR